MRSRYSAFALGEIAWLVETLATAHEDRAAVRAGADPRALEASLRDVCRTSRFMGLTVLDAREDGDRAVVRFRASVFVGGRDRSFEETSEFLREGGAWRYVGASRP
jgi:SEC-C motif-containing protein